MTRSDLSDTVFVYGALRSGTTLLNLMLNGHPAIHNPGEVDPLLDFIAPDPDHPTGWRYDRARMEGHRLFRALGIALPDGADGLDLFEAMIGALRAKSDKPVLSLTVHRNAGRLKRILPEARILHLLRDPRDVARSAVGMGWAGNSYVAVGGWIETETEWDRAGFDADRVMTLKFEDLLADPEASLDRVARFHGMAYDPAMLDYPRTSTYGPPDPKTAQQWRRKARPREIGLIEARIGPMMTARGYPPEHPRPLPGPAEETLLRAQHRIARWGYNIRRFGLPLFLGRHLARRTGLGALERRLAARQDEIIIRNQK
ncbi:Sulfotransferase family protein [Rhodovulum sp. ES.010]|uniref:sulfotransferase family protein n=1 Tax=Rhodovulum sp. ES.010 TaxID=1882821 RepID=UPI00092A4BED|nr:sulfotransferase [Rhodovulum sp. ES.010]SIO59811.1 Sulfotransferase family protein [Rhodovulum sp. ES.010]